jgi:hypothetical protein
MDWNHLPWDQGLATVFGLVLLKMLYDLVYKKIPRGLRAIRQALRYQREQLGKKMDQNTEAIDLLREEVINLEDMQLEQSQAKEAARPRIESNRRRRKHRKPPNAADGG